MREPRQRTSTGVIHLRFIDLYATKSHIVQALIAKLTRDTAYGFAVTSYPTGALKRSKPSTGWLRLQLNRQVKGRHRIEKGLSRAALFRCSRRLFNCRFSKAPVGVGPTHKGFADLPLPAWVRRHAR